VVDGSSSDRLDTSPSAALTPTGVELSDSGLLCPQCDYNLTGTIAAAEAGMGENRCPECGRVFNPDILRGRVPGPIEIWDDTNQSIVIRYIKMCLITWFMPWRLPRMIPPCYEKRSLWKFGRITLAIAYGSIIATQLLIGWMADLFLTTGSPWSYSPGMEHYHCNTVAAFLSILILPSWVGMMACEALLVVRRNANQRAMVGFCRSFTLLSSVALGCVTMADFFVGSFRLPWFTIGRYHVPWLLFFGVPVVVWWIIALGIAMNRVSASKMRSILRLLFIPIAVALAILLGIGVFWAFVVTIVKVFSL